MLKLTGDVGSTNQIQYVTDLSQTNNWLTLTNIVLSNSPSYFVDTSGAPKRYYQAVLLTGAPTNLPVNPDPEHLVWISPGTFTMGSSATEAGRDGREGPQMVVTLTKGFWMGAYEVTQREYLDLVGNNPSHYIGDLNRPVEGVAWDEANDYCVKLTERERAARRLPTGYAYRLPTEAEWEYACRAGTTTRFSHGDDPGYAQLGQFAWYWENSWSSTRPSGVSSDFASRYYTTHPVGTKQPNAWGLYDMAGNVWEWCSDWYWSYPGGSVTDWKGPSSGVHKVNRGGSWFDGGGRCRSASRNGLLRGYLLYELGFRFVLATGQ